MRVINYTLSQCVRFLAKIKTETLPHHCFIDSVPLCANFNTQINCPDQIPLFKASF